MERAESQSCFTWAPRWTPSPSPPTAFAFCHQPRPLSPARKRKRDKWTWTSWTDLMSSSCQGKRGGVLLHNLISLHVCSEVSSGQEQQVVRQAKFLQYWMTTTSTTTITTFTATSTMHSLQCTPSNFPLAACGRWLMLIVLSKYIFKPVSR